VPGLPWKRVREGAPEVRADVLECHGHRRRHTVS
jgi:hypothetical protein